MRPFTDRSPLAPARRLSIAWALLAATALTFPACGSPSSSTSGSGSTSTGGDGDAVKGPPVEGTLFAPSKSILADLPVLKLVPKETQVVFAARDPATIVAKLGALAGFAEAKEPIAKELDDAAKEISKDLPELAALAANGVDLAKPAGVMWTDHELDTAVIFAAVSDEAAMKKWLEERAKQSNGKRELIPSGDGLILRAKRDVTRAVVLRKGFVFWVRTREKFGLDPKRVTSAADALAQTAEADSLGADATFTKAVASLAYGAEASLFVNAGRFAEGIVAARTKALESAQKGLDEAKAKLAAAEQKKRKSAAEDAKYEVDNAQRAVNGAERRAKQVEALGAMKDEVPAIAVGVELGERDVRLKAFVAMPKPGAVKLFAPLAGPSPVFDASIAARSAGRFAIDPRVLDFVLEHLGATSITRDLLPIERGKSVLSSLGVDMKAMAPLFDGEVSAATHAQTLEAAASDDAGAPDAGPKTEGARDAGGYTVVWHLSDAAKASALIEDAWKGIEPTERAAKGEVKHPGPAALDRAWRPGALVEHVRVLGSSLVVTTHPALLDPAADAKPRATWMASAQHPALKQLAGIEGASGIVAFEGPAWRRDRNADLWGSLRSNALRDAADFGMIGLFGGPPTKKGKKLEEERSKLRDQIRELEKSLEAHKEATWAAFAPRLGTTALFAKPAEGGVAIYGGLFTSEASVTALAEAALGAWLSAGPRWEKWGEMAELKKKIRALDDQLEAERAKAMDDMIGSVLQGLGASDRAGAGGLGRFGGFDDDVGSLLGPGGGLSGVGVGMGGLGTVGSGRGGGGTGDAAGSGRAGGGALAPGGGAPPPKKP